MFDKAFRQEGWIYSFLNRLWDILVLDFLFLITSIPLFTIGASLTALYSVTLKAVKKEESYIVKSYFRAWRENFKKSTIIWLFYAAAGIILAIDIFVIGVNAGSMGKVLVFLGGIAMIIWLFMGTYLLPLQARFENTLGNTVINSLLISVKFLPNTLQILGILAMVPLLGVAIAILLPSVFSWYCSLLFFVGIPGIAYVSSFIYRSVFDRVSAEGETSDEKLVEVHNNSI